MDEATIQALIPIAIAAYVIGSIPTAVIVVKRFTGRDVMALGTGNVGTMNTLRATNSKKLTLVVLLGDMGKGCAGAAVGVGGSGGVRLRASAGDDRGRDLVDSRAQLLDIPEAEGWQGVGDGGPGPSVHRAGVGGSVDSDVPGNRLVDEADGRGSNIGDGGGGVGRGIRLPGHGDTGGDLVGDHLHKTRAENQEHHRWDGAPDVLQDKEVGGRGGLKWGVNFAKTLT